MSFSEEFEEDCVDADICSENEISKLFSESLVLTNEQTVSEDYLLFMDSTSDFTQLAAASASLSVHLYDLNIGKVHTSFGTGTAINIKDSEQICGLRFPANDANQLFISTNTAVYLYDLRTKMNPVQLIEGNSNASGSFTCFDLNSNGKVICIGTEESVGEANLLLYDVRTKSLLTTYTDSHDGDVTQVKFHPTKRNYLASGSTDGLINIYNINESCEDDALENSLNTESSIQTINWHSLQSSPADEQHDYLACITHTNDFQLFDVESSDLQLKCERKDVAAAIKRKAIGDCYLINSHTLVDGTIFCLAGSNFNNGECMRSLQIRDKMFVPFNNFVDAKQIIRCSLFNSKHNILVTAGEGGLISLWSNANKTIDKSQKMTTKVEKANRRKSKPY